MLVFGQFITSSSQGEEDPGFVPDFHAFLHFTPIYTNPQKNAEQTLRLNDIMVGRTKSCENPSLTCTEVHPATRLGRPSAQNLTAQQKSSRIDL